MTSLVVVRVARAPAARAAAPRSASHRRLQRSSASAANAASSRGELAGVGEVGLGAAPSSPAVVDDRRQLGVAAAQPAGERLVGVHLGVGQRAPRGRRARSTSSSTDCAVPAPARRSRLSVDRSPELPNATNAAGAGPATAERRRRASRELLAAGALAVPGLEPGDPATGVHDLLLAGVERVAGEQTSTLITPFCFVLRVVNWLPQPQVTWVSTYSGWMPVFMVAGPLVDGRRVPCWCVGVNRRQLCHRAFSQERPLVPSTAPRPAMFPHGGRAGPAV